MSRRSKVVVGVLSTLNSLPVLHASGSWLEQGRFSPRTTRSLMPSGLEEPLKVIKHIVQQAGGDDEKWEWPNGESKSWGFGKDDRSILVNILILNIIHRRAAALQASPGEGLNINHWPGDEAIGRDAARYVRFASSAYGRSMAEGHFIWSSMEEFSRQEVDPWYIVRHCGIDAEDLVKVDLSEPRELHLPGYVLATDHTTKSVVLSVRGTVSLKDLYTDLLCDSVEFMGGYCHRGLRQSAEVLLALAKDDIVGALRHNKGYRLVLCGHSLGGGVSTLLTMLILRRREELGISPTTEVLCYAFAPPPVFAPLKQLPTDAKQAIRSFVFGDDFVPRLSLASAHGLFRDLKEVGSIEANAVDKLGHWMQQNMRQVGTDTTHTDDLEDLEIDMFRRFAAVIRRPRSRRSRRIKGGGSRQTDSRKRNSKRSPLEAFVESKLGQDFAANGRVRFRLGKDKVERLMIPGSIFHLRNLRNTIAADSEKGHQTEYWMERRPPTEFTRLLILAKAIEDHGSLGYEEALHYLYGDGLPKE